MSSETDVEVIKLTNLIKTLWRASKILKFKSFLHIAIALSARNKKPAALHTSQNNAKRQRVCVDNNKQHSPMARHVNLLMSREWQLSAGFELFSSDVKQN